MKFIPQKTCKNLKDLGCKSKSNFWYIKIKNKWDKYAYYDPCHKNRLNDKDFLPAFILEDFFGTHRQANKNRHILNFIRLEKISDCDDWVKFIEDIVDKIK